MGEVPGCNPEPCDLICQLKKYSPLIAVVGLVMVGMVTFKGGGGSGGSRSDYGVNLDQMFYGYK